MGNRLEGKAALVTGGATGIGLAIAERFVNEGAQVVITDVNEAAGNEAAERLNARFEVQDVSSEDRWIEIFDMLKADGITLTTLVNNAGVFFEGGVPVEDIDLDITSKILDINVKGVMMGCKHAVRNMKTTGGSIINLSSIGGLIPTTLAVAYGVSKAGVYQLTKTVALHCAEQGYGIRCNSIHPGLIQTDMQNKLWSEMAEANNISIDEAKKIMSSKVPTGEIAQPEDVANAALYLASDESSQVTGDKLMVDGGMYLIS